MPESSKIFVPNRGLGYVSNHVPLQVRYIKSRKENLIVTCIGKSFHTYGISHFGLLSVSGLHHGNITAMTVDTYHVYTACDNVIYAWRRGTELKHTYRGHRKSVHVMVPFGEHLISIDESSNVKIWDIKTEVLYCELTFSNNQFHITTLLHPSTYINKILLGSEQGQLQLWNIHNVKLIYTFKGWQSAVTCTVQAPAIDVVAIGLASGKILLHNLKYDETIMEFVQDWGLVTTISFRTDNNPIMATGSVNGNIVFWNLEERRVASQLISAHDGAVTGMVCLQDEPLMLTSSPDNTLKLWIFDKTDGGARLLRIREGHSAPPNYIRFHGSNGHNILSAAGDSTLRIFNTQTEQFNKNLGKASYNRKISKKRGRAVEDPLKMPPIIEFTSETTREKEWDNIAAVHLGLPLITTWSYDKVKMGDLKLLPERLHKKNRSLDVEVCATTLCLSHCGNFVVVGYSSGHIDRFNMQSGLWRDSYGDPNAHKSVVRGISVDGLNKIVISGGSDCKIKFWPFKCKGKQEFKTIDATDAVHFFRSHQESSMLAVALEDFTIVIVDIDVKEIVRKFSGHFAQITDATFSPDSRWLITTSMDCSIRTWDIPTGQLIDQFRTDAACVSVNMSPTGECIATAHVDYLGIFLWSNKTIYSHITLKALTPEPEPPILSLPEDIDLNIKVEEIDSDIKEEEVEFKSPEQISSELLTLSGLSTSRWQNLLNLDIIKKRNKPIAPPKVPKAAPFFLPTIPSMNIKFDLEKEKDTALHSKLLVADDIINLTTFGKALDKTRETNDFTMVITTLKQYGPSMIDFEIKSLSPEGGGNVDVMLQFLKCIEYMLQSNKDFELAQAYLSVFLKEHGNRIAEEDRLKNYIPSIQSCSSVCWNKLQEKLLYNMCIITNLKTML